LIEKGGLMMKRLRIFLMFVALWIIYEPSSFAESTLQQQIDQTPAGGILIVKSGTYEDPVSINKPMTIKGTENTVLSYTGEGSFLNISGEGVQISNIEIEATRLPIEESAIVLAGNYHKLSNLTIKSAGTGIKLDKANHVSVLESSFTGTSEGHAINLWESNYNTFGKNSIRNVQDGFYVEYSHHNTFKNNKIWDAHYGVHLMYSNSCLIEENESFNNFTGAMIMGAEDAMVRKNKFAENNENVNSQGLLLYDSRNVTVETNEIHNNRIGIFIEKANVNTVKDNRLQSNFVGIQFKESENNRIYQNDFLGNVNDAQAIESEGNQLDGNYWDASAKIDSDGDGISNLNYRADPYFLALTEEVPEYQLFFQAPGMTILQKMLKSTDEELLTDSAPLMKPIQSNNQNNHADLSVWIVSGLLFIGSLFLFIKGRKQR
jgi:nitrous oxidase accessory protein